MIYRVYLRTFYTEWVKVHINFKSLDEVNDYLDKVTDFTDYIVMGYDKNKEPYTDYGKIDRPLVKKLVRKNGDK